jgi:Methyltransferase domain
MAGPLTWDTDERCVVGNVAFQTVPAELFDLADPSISLAGADFLLLKPRFLVERYAEVLEELRPRRIVELGILEGGSTALLWELARPRVMVAIDQRPPHTPALRKLDDGIRIYGDVDQADRERLAEIAGDALGDEPLDLVVDDCSHMYGATRASFNEPFPRLRAGGLYTIEDWDWTRHEKIAEMWADQVPLTRLILELSLVLASGSGLISEMTISPGLTQVRRGNPRIDPRGFDLGEFIDASGRSLLARGEGVGGDLPSLADRRAPDGG